MVTDSAGVEHHYGGIMGILGAAGVVFFAFIGFDAVSTAAQEAKIKERHADRYFGFFGRLYDPLRVVFLRIDGASTCRVLPNQGRGGVGHCHHHRLHAGL